MKLSSVLCQSFRQLNITNNIKGNTWITSTGGNTLCSKFTRNLIGFNQKRDLNIRYVDAPAPEKERRNLRYFPVKPKEYTHKVLPVRRLGGRDPQTGRAIFKAVGGGLPKEYYWLDYTVKGPSEEGKYYEERVVAIHKYKKFNSYWTAHIATVCNGTRLRNIIATSSMEVGNLIRTSSYIPPVPFKPKPGDTHCLGAMTPGTEVCCLQTNPAHSRRLLINAGTSGLVRKIMDGKVLVQLSKKRYIVVDKSCQATVGQCSNTGHINEDVGSFSNFRLMGRRPRSGLHKKKTGRFGRKIKPPSTVDYTKQAKKRLGEYIKLNYDYFQPNREITPSTMDPFHGQR